MVASSQTTASWVSDLRGRPRHWATATSAPCTSLFKPVAVCSPLDLGPPPTNVFDAASPWWRHELLHRTTMHAYGTLIARYRHARDRTEARWIDDPPAPASAFAEAERVGTRGWPTWPPPDLPDSRPSWVRRHVEGRRPRRSHRQGARHVTDTRVLVIGAGLSGLAAARTLHAAGAEVRVLEARGRVGGRTEGGSTADGTPVELGGQWLGPTQTRMYALTEELGLETFPTYNTGQHMIQLGGRKTRMASKRGAVPKLNPFVLADLFQGMTRFKRLADKVPLDRPWTGPGAKALDNQTFESWIMRNLRTPTGRTYFRVATEAVFSAESGNLSALHALFYAHSGTDLEGLLSTDRGAQQDRIVGGSIRVSESMAAALGDRVTLDSPVRRIEQEQGRVVVTTRGGEVFEADRAIVTLPPTLAGRLEYAPALPSWRDQLTQRLPPAR